MSEDLRLRCDRSNPVHWERDLVVAVLVQAVRDCFFLGSNSGCAYNAYNFLMDDRPWDLIGASHRCRDTVRNILPHPSQVPAWGEIVQGNMPEFTELR